MKGLTYAVSVFGSFQAEKLPNYFALIKNSCPHCHNTLSSSGNCYDCGYCDQGMTAYWLNKYAMRIIHTMPDFKDKRL